VRPTKVNETVVLLCASVCLVLGSLVAPLAGDGVVSWLAVAIGVLLVGQWVLMRRNRRADR